MRIVVPDRLQRRFQQRSVRGIHRQRHRQRRHERVAAQRLVQCLRAVRHEHRGAAIGGGATETPPHCACQICSSLQDSRSVDGISDCFGSSVREASSQGNDAKLEIRGPCLVEMLPAELPPAFAQAESRRVDAHKLEVDNSQLAPCRHLINAELCGCRGATDRQSRRPASTGVQIPRQHPRGAKAGAAARDTYLPGQQRHQGLCALWLHRGAPWPEATCCATPKRVA